MRERIVLRVRRVVAGLKGKAGVWLDSERGSTDITQEAGEKEVGPQTYELRPVCGIPVNIPGSYRFDFIIDSSKEGLAAVIPMSRTADSSITHDALIMSVHEPRNPEFPSERRLSFWESGYVVHVIRLHDESAKVRIKSYMAVMLDGKPMVVIDNRYEGIIPMYQYAELDSEAKIGAIRDILCQSPKMVKRFAEDLAAGAVTAYESICQSPEQAFSKLGELVPEHLLSRFKGKAGDGTKPRQESRQDYEQRPRGRKSHGRGNRRWNDRLQE